MSCETYAFTPEEVAQWTDLTAQINEINAVFKKRQRKVARYLKKLKLGIEPSQTEIEKTRERHELSTMRKKLKKQRHELMLVAHERLKASRQGVEANG
jgi:hypothetical protein